MPTNNPELKNEDYIAVAKGQDATDSTKVLPILLDPNSGALLCEA